TERERERESSGRARSETLDAATMVLFFDHFLFVSGGWFRSVVSGRERGLAAHSSCSEHERRWKAEDHVRAYLHQGYRSPLRQHRLQKGRMSKRLLFFNPSSSFSTS
ncbi:hypothetical protein BHM03_00053621, partial [Ensete ventricosum]